MARRATRIGLALAALALIGCAEDQPTADDPTGEESAGTAGSPTGSPVVPSPSSSVPAALQRFPDVVDVEIVRTGNDVFRFDVTISSPYDTPERYADAWRILGPDGQVFGTRDLAHDHAGEQPFTRSLDDVSIPPEITTVTVEGRDREYGWGGATKDTELPGG